MLNLLEFWVKTGGDADPQKRNADHVAAVACSAGRRCRRGRRHRRREIVLARASALAGFGAARSGGIPRYPLNYW